MTRRRRRRTGFLAVIILVAVCLVWAPALIAIPYTRGPGGVQNVWQRPDLGWKFLFDAITESRQTQLGTADAALQRAQELWGGAPAYARSVTLTWTGGTFRVPVPRGGTVPGPVNRTASPDSALEWIVMGRIADGPSQMIGMLDYQTGHLRWDIRNRVPSA